MVNWLALVDENFARPVEGELVRSGFLAAMLESSYSIRLFGRPSVKFVEIKSGHVLRESSIAFFLNIRLGENLTERVLEWIRESGNAVCKKGTIDVQSSAFTETF